MSGPAPSPSAPFGLSAPHRVFALTTRGLEGIAAEEIARIPGAAVIEVGYRRVAASCPAVGPLAALRCVDDVFLELAAWDGLIRPRATLARLAALAGALDLRAAQQVCRGLRLLPRRPSFSVTPSFVGKRNYGNEEIKAAVAAAIAASHGWEHRERDEEADLNLRLFIEHERGFVGVRLARRPLHERAYKREHAPGSLRPSVAAAMVAISGAGAATTIVDPCCGVGTIVLEARACGSPAIGGDIDEAVVRAARANAMAAGSPPDLARWDMRALPLRDGSAGRVVCNPPWGLQVAAGTDLAALHRLACAEIERVLAPGGLAVLLAYDVSLLGFARLRCQRRIGISLSGQTPEVLVYG